MNSFLYNLAENFYKIYGNQISDFTFVFPNRRSGVFFQRYLSQVADNVMFSPQISTINELFQAMSSLKMIDKTRLLFTIYNVYKRETESAENFDEFIYWGEMLLNDFDDIDKYMVDAKKLFTNITDLKQIDDEFAFLEEDQIEIVRKFWVNFIPSFSSDKKVNFIHIWEKLYAIYIGLKNNLKTDGLGYEGMIYRDVIDSLEKGQTLLKLKTTKIIFIGFNALTTCEKRLMNNLRDKDIADFYWDYDDEILKDRNNKASFFYYDNVNNYPSQISINPNIDLKKKNIEVLGIPSGIGQAKYIPEIIEDLISEGKISDPKHALETAIVLADENLLIPTLYSIPENINPINVTMGKSLKNTPIAGLLDHIFDLQLNLNFKNKDTLFYYKDVLAVLNHTFIMFYDEKTTLQLIKQITKENKIYLTSEELSGNELLSRIFKPVNSVGKALAYLRKILELLQNESSEIDDENEVRKLSELEKEFIYHYYITLNRLNDVLNEFSVEIKVRTFFRLLSKMTENISVPFHGEPLSGLQIMGVLETRALDFKNLIILSMNEGVFPLKKSANSFIPVNLRKGFGLSTNEHQDAIYAYHFYRMISRAENVFLLYDTRSNGLQTGEVSRYVYQMKYHYGIELKEKTVTYDIGISKYSPINIDKSDRIFNKLNKFLSDDNKRFLSASSINSYINCPLQFYFKLDRKSTRLNSSHIT